MNSPMRPRWAIPSRVSCRGVTAEDVDAIWSDLHPVDCAKILAAVGHVDRSLMVPAIVDASNMGVGIVVCVDEAPVVCVLAHPDPMAEHRWIGAGLGTSRMRRGIPGLVRAVKGILLPSAWDRGAVRVESMSPASYEGAHSWILKSGAVREGVVRRWGFGGEDFVQFAWLKPEK